MNRMLDKLRSRSGASITFALLLFLVCAVLSTVIITTASTAAGRMSNMAEADQRYYSVTSASELLKELLDGKTVSIVKVTGGDNAGTYLVPKMGAEQASVSYAKVEYKVADGNAAIIKDSIVNKAAYTHYNGGNNNGTISGQKITISGADLADTEPEIEETMNSAGEITMTVSKASGINTNPFSIKMVFSLDQKDITGTKTIGTDTITTKATSYTWYLRSMNVISATGAGE